MPLGVWGAVWGSLLSCCCLRVIKRLTWLYFKVVRISAKKARIQKNVMLYNFFTFLFERSRADFVPISSDFRRFWAGEGLRVLYITPFSADCPIWTRFDELQRGFKRVFGVLSVLGCRLAVGGGCWVRQVASSCEKVGLYIYIYYFRYIQY